MLSSKNFIKIIKIGVYLALIAPLIYIAQAPFAAVFGKMVFFQIAIEAILPFFLFLIIFHKEFRPKINWLTKLILLFFGIIFLSSIFGIDWHQAFWGEISRMAGIFNLLHFLLLYFYIITVFKTEKDKKNILLFVLAVALLVAVFGIIERINPELSIDKTSIKNESGHRIISTTGNPIFLAGYMLFIFFLSGYYFLKYKDKTRLFALIAGFLALIALLFTGTRAGFVGLVAGILGALFYLFLSVSKKKKLILIGAILGIIIICSILFFANSNTNFLNLNRLTELDWKGGSITGRLLLWNVSLEAFKQKPIIGWGWQNFTYAFDANYHPQFLRNGVNETFSDRAHNWYLDILVMSGILGFLAYLFIFIYIFYKLLIRKFYLKEKMALFGLFLAFLAYSFFAVDAPSVYLMLFFSFSIVYFLSENPKDIIKQQSYTNNNYLLLIVFIALASFLIYNCNIKPLQAGINFIELKRTSHPKISQIEGVLINNPYKYNFQQYFANNVFLHGPKEFIERAIKETQSLQQQYPKNFSYAFLLANLYLKKGNQTKNKEILEKSIFYYKKALLLSPKRQSVMYQKATAHFLLEDYESAITEIEKSIFLDTEIGQGYWRLAATQLANKEKEKAYNNFKKAMSMGFMSSILDEKKKAANLCEEVKDDGCVLSLVISIYRQLIESEPKNGEYHLEIAKAYLYKKNVGEARAYAQKALELDSSLESEAQSILNSLK